MYFCIRDDDTSFFTSPEDLERAYTEITHWGPVSLAVVPFCRAGKSKGVPESLRERWTVHPLHENLALVDYLRHGIKEGRFEIMLHGYNHDERSGTPEFAVDDRDLASKTLEGRKYLEDVLRAEVRVFVPPHNSIGRRGLRAVARAGLDLGCMAGVRSGWPVVSLTTWQTWLRLRKWRQSGNTGIPWVVDLGDHRELSGNPITPFSSLRSTEAVFQTALNSDGVFCAATHYWEFGVRNGPPEELTVREQLLRLISLAKSDPRVKWRTVGSILAGKSR